MTSSFDEMTHQCMASIDEVLKRQADIFWNVEKRVLEGMLGGLKPAAALDIGAGNAYYLSKMATIYPDAYSKPNQSTIPKQTSPPFQSKPVQHSEANQSTCF